MAPVAMPTYIVPADDSHRSDQSVLAAVFGCFTQGCRREVDEPEERAESAAEPCLCGTGLAASVTDHITLFDQPRHISV